MRDLATDERFSHGWNTDETRMKTQAEPLNNQPAERATGCSQGCQPLENEARSPTTSPRSGRQASVRGPAGNARPKETGASAAHQQPIPARTK